ncbi:MAG: NAD(P)H-quinone oxidoreductase subunit D4, partial [Cyanobium sp.]
MPSFILPLLLALPIAATLILPVLSGDHSVRLRTLAALACGAQFVVALACWRLPPADLHLAWLPRLKLALDLGLDGLSLPLVVLTALLSTLAILSAPEDQSRPRLFYSLLLATNVGVVGAFLARNALLFVLAFEVVLIPATLLVATWGGPRKAGAAIRYLVYGSV